MEEELRAFLQRYIGQGVLKKDKVNPDDVEMLVYSAHIMGVEKNIIDYGLSHPEAPFWDFLKFGKPGLYGLTQEELLEDEED